MSELTRITAAGKDIEIFTGEPGSPIVYLNTYEGEGAEVVKRLQEIGAPSCTLAAISKVYWNVEMSPWPMPPLLKETFDFTGGADDYIAILSKTIVPAVEENLPAEPSFRAIAGYSLAGLFAVYALYQTDIFTHAVSASGSLWYPNFLEYAKAHEFAGRPDSVYFSLGDKESHTRNSLMKIVEERTIETEKLFASRGVNTTYVSNPGNHFSNSELRTAMGIKWLLEQQRN
ncbi:MAG: alpha/beta hydrolase [Eubacterium sp.]|jgi:predicted alpha/beta superfamily hydrolase